MQIPSVLVKFLISGGFNTTITYVIYLLLLKFLPYRISYTITFISGIAIAYLLSRFFVFGRPRAGKRVLLFPGIYFVQYVLGMTVVLVWVEVAHFKEALAPVASILVTIPVTFILTKWVFGAKHIA